MHEGRIATHLSGVEVTSTCTGRENTLKYPTPEQDLPAVKDQFYPPRWREIIGTRMAAGVLALSAALGAGSEYYTGDPLFIPKSAVDYTTNYGPTVSPDTLALVNDLVDRPADPELKALFNIPVSPESNQSPDQWDRQYQLFAIKKAAENGLTVVDPESYRQQINHATNFSDVEAAVDQYTQRLGFGFAVPDKKDLLDVGMDSELVDPSTIDLERFKQGANSLLGILMLMPKEVHEFADVREVRIVDHIASVENDVVGSFNPDGRANAVSGIIHIPIDQLYKANFALYMHEFGHRLDYKISGGLAGMTRHASYKGLNPDGFEYGDPDTPDLELAVPELYSATNVLEDKANMFEAMLNGLSSDYLYHSEGPVRNKYRYLLGLLNERVPGSVSYLVGISGGKDLIVEEQRDGDMFVLSPDPVQPSR